MFRFVNELRKICGGPARAAAAVSTMFQSIFFHPLGLPAAFPVWLLVGPATSPAVQSRGMPQRSTAQPEPECCNFLALLLGSAVWQLLYQLLLLFAEAIVQLPLLCAVPYLCTCCRTQLGMSQHSRGAPVPDSIASVQLHRQRVLRSMRHTTSLSQLHLWPTGQLPVQPANKPTATVLTQH
jgi:hypothetical protein